MVSLQSGSHNILHLNWWVKSESFILPAWLGLMLDFVLICRELIGGYGDHSSSASLPNEMFTIENVLCCLYLVCDPWLSTFVSVGAHQSHRVLESSNFACWTMIFFCLLLIHLSWIWCFCKQTRWGTAEQFAIINVALSPPVGAEEQRHLWECQVHSARKLLDWSQFCEWVCSCSPVAVLPQADSLLFCFFQYSPPSHSTLFINSTRVCVGN